MSGNFVAVPFSYDSAMGYHTQAEGLVESKVGTSYLFCADAYGPMLGCAVASCTAVSSRAKDGTFIGMVDAWVMIVWSAACLLLLHNESKETGQ